MATETPEPTETLLTDAALHALTEKANAGDRKAAAQLRLVVEANPQLWQNVGNLAAHAELTLVKAISGGNELLSQSILRHAQELRAQLGWGTASALERLAIERVVASSLHMYHRDAEAILSPGSPELRLCATRTQDSAHRRVDAATKMLLMVKHVEKDVAVRVPPLRMADVDEMAPADPQVTQPTNAAATGGEEPPIELQPSLATAAATVDIQPDPAFAEEGAIDDWPFDTPRNGHSVNGHPANGHAANEQPWHNRVAIHLPVEQV